jgi:hypothetical protein
LIQPETGRFLTVFSHAIDTQKDCQVREMTMPDIAISSTFHFSETEPTPLLTDFEAFTWYLEQNSFALGKTTGYIPYKHLATLNQAMTHPNTENSPQTPQHHYPQLHLFYHLALAGKLFHRIHRKNQTFLEAAERLAAYRALTAAEKYFSLLETLWIDCSWEELGKPRSSSATIFTVSEFLQDLCGWEPEAPIYAKDEPAFLRGNVLFLSGTVIQCFAFFGWYEVERDLARDEQSRGKDFYPIACLTPSSLGIALAEILTSHRPLEEWNIPHLRSEGMLPTMKDLKAKASSDFAGLFRPICAEGELRSILPRAILQKAQGNFLFKVSVSPKVWRIIALSSKHTLDDLHYAIQQAFDFDADHLYAFYMDHRLYSEERFESPDAEEGPRADEVTIGELGLAVNQSFIYHFDFGDDWRFGVQLLEIKTDEPLLKKPKILEEHGKAPEQYPEAEW